MNFSFDTHIWINKYFQFSEFSVKIEEIKKIDTELRLAACIRKIMQENRKVNIKNEKKNNLVDEVRQLEASSRLSYTIVQGVSTEERNPQFATLIALIKDCFEMTLTDFAKIYDSISEEEEVRNTKKKIAKSRKSFRKQKKIKAPKITHVATYSMF